MKYSLEARRLAGDVIFPGMCFSDIPFPVNDEIQMERAMETLGLDQIDVFLIGGWNCLDLDNYESWEVELDKQYVTDHFGTDSVTENDLRERRHRISKLVWDLLPY